MHYGTPEALSLFSIPNDLVSIEYTTASMIILYVVVAAVRGNMCKDDTELVGKSLFCANKTMSYISEMKKYDLLLKPPKSIAIVSVP